MRNIHDVFQFDIIIFSCPVCICLDISQLFKKWPYVIANIFSLRFQNGFLMSMPSNMHGCNLIASVPQLTSLSKVLSHSILTILRHISVVNVSTKSFHEELSIFNEFESHVCCRSERSNWYGRIVLKEFSPTRSYEITV